MKKLLQQKSRKATACTKKFKAYKKETREIMISALAESIKPNPNNRGGDIDWDKVHFIAKSVAEYGTEYLLMPITVDMNTNIITEGHHTYYALLEILEKYGYDFTVTVQHREYPSNKSIDEVTAEINNDRNGWRLNNYINLHINQGNKNYINLKKMAEEVGGVFMKNGEPRWRYISALGGRSFQQELREGTYQLSDKQMEDQIELGKLINDLIKKAGVTQIATWLESFTLAFVHGISQYSGRIRKNYIKSVYNRVDSIVFDGSQSTCVWAGRLSGLDKEA